MKQSPDLLAFVQLLPYSPYVNEKDRYAEFRKFFLTDEGKRILSEILSWGHMHKPSFTKVPIDPYLTHVREGERNIALKLLHVINYDPPEKPKKTRSK